MVKKLNNTEIMTKKEAREKYEKYFFAYTEVEQNLRNPCEAKVIVIYTADNKQEAYEKIPQGYDENGNWIVIAQGSEAFDDTIELGGGIYFA